ncbi:MAG: hypothetical protein GY898_00955 [Proteobacteria bacterium]|nr:hypothetical protein [Pseudomonadota bacterium]
MSLWRAVLVLLAVVLSGCPVDLGPVPGGPDDTTWGPGDDDDVADDDDSATDGDDDDDSAVEPPLPEDAAVIVASSFPATLACGEEAAAEVTVRNDGTVPWTRAEGYKLGALGEGDPLHPGDARIWLQDDDAVPPGAEHTFVISLVAPDEPATLLSDWQMVHEFVHWFGEPVEATIEVECEAVEYPLPLPDMSWVVDDVAAAHPDLLAASCLDDGGGWAFLDAVVDELRTYDERWGYNWKRGVIGDPSEDVVDYHYGPGPTFEDSPDVYIIDVIVGHCGPSPSPGWLDQTQATLDAGEIGRWTGRGRF